MAQLTEIATVFSFGDRTDIATAAAGKNVYLAAAGGANSALAPVSTILNAIVTRPGTLKNLYWSCDPPNSLPGTGNNFTIFVNGAITTLSASCNSGATSGSDTTNSVAVAAGDRVSVRLQLAGGATTNKIPKPRASFELEVPSTNPWQAAGTDVYYDQGNVGIGTTTPSEMLTVNGAVESTIGGFKFPDGTIQATAAGGAGGGIPASALFAAANENIGIGTTSPEERLTLAADSNSATEMATPTGVTATAKSGGSLPLATYYFRIVAEDGAGGTTTGSLPEAFCTITAANRTAHLDWAPVQGARSYLVYIGTALGGQNKYLTSPTNSFDYPSVSPSEIPGTVPPVTTAFVNKLSAAGSSWILGGNVGIGTSNPQAKLDVAGNAVVDGDVGIGTTNIVGALTINAGQDRMLNVRGDPAAWGRSQAGVILQGVNSAQNAEVPITLEGTATYINPEGGNVGIGTTNPQAKLDVNGSLRADTIVGGQLNSAGNLHIDAHTLGATRAVYINWSHGTGGLVVGNGGIGGTGYGPVTALDFIKPSSREAKMDIASSPYGLSEILKLEAVKFRYKDDKSKTVHIGLIAEEVALVMPEMVSKMENENKGTIGIDYGEFASVLIEAVKEQQQQIEELKDTVKSLLVDKSKAAGLA